MNDHTPNTVGVDISKAHLDAHELPTGRAVRFDNDTAGIAGLSRWISPDVDCVVYESTGSCHREFEEALAGALTRDRTAVLNRSGQARHPLVKRQLKLRLRQIERQIKALDAEIGKLIAADDALSRRAEILTSIPGVAEVTAAALMAEMPELGRLEAKAAASLAGLAPVTRESGAWKGRSFIRGGRSGARRVLFMAALTAITHNPDMARKYRQLRARGKPAKVALTAVMRKLVVLANALLQQDRPWSPRAVPETGSALATAGQ